MTEPQDQQPRVLIVDDNDANRYAAARILQNAGYRTLEAATGGEGLEAAEREQPDVIMLDVQLPDIIGFEVAQRLRANPKTRHLAVLQISASYTDADAKATGLEAGADSYLTHPVEPQVLIGTIQALIRVRTAERALSEALERERRAHAEAEASARQFKLLAEAIPQIVYVAGRDGTPEYYNQNWFSYTREDPRSLPDWTTAVHEDQREEIRSGWQDALRQGTDFRAELRLCRHDGAYRWHLLRALPLQLWESGEVVRWFATFTDIHELKEAQRERERLAAELRRAVQDRDELLAIASHDLRSPLSALGLRLDLLIKRCQQPEQYPEPEDLREQLDGLRATVTRLGGMLEDLLDISQVSSGHIRLNATEVDLAAIAAEVVGRCAEEASASDTPLRLQTDGAVWGEWDRLRLEQVVSNLVSNAVKYGAGSPVDVYVDWDGDQARLMVQDRGRGIAADQQKAIFQRYRRLNDDLSARESGSFGLGLWIVQRIVSAFGGEVGVDSQPGEGSCFTVRLPCRRR